MEGFLKRSAGSFSISSSRKESPVMHAGVFNLVSSFSNSILLSPWLARVNVSILDDRMPGRKRLANAQVDPRSVRQK